MLPTALPTHYGRFQFQVNEALGYHPQLVSEHALCYQSRWVKIIAFWISIKGSFLLFNQFSSVAQSCPTVCNPMNRSTPGLPVNYQLSEFTQTHVHRVGDAIQPSHPLSSPSPPAPIPPSNRVFSSESTLRMKWPKYWSFSFSISPSNEHPGLISFRMDWLDLLAVQGTLKSLLQQSINSSVLSFCHSPTLTSIHDHWKNHSLD